MKDLDKYVLTAMLYIFGWSLAFFIAWIVIGEEPSILEGCILTPGVVELICTAYIKLGKKSNPTTETNDDFEIIDIENLEDTEE